MQERQRSAASTAGDWQRRAEMALRAGDEDLARAALTRRKSYQVTGHTLHACQALHDQASGACRTSNGAGTQYDFDELFLRYVVGRTLAPGRREARCALPD